ncbi:MerR family transcriptional regulator [Streptomyces filamentosus]|uniref:MerR family transcriptional regulator n=2 Tax=Streptomyces filamentosus TaxID=67294 RepID=A0ABY4UPU8_STRFL|nr:MULTISPECIES: MerR family transcriptional regulator [Streptomyces]EWS95282.1 MerR family transcriptional regulator [Streptomyces filamentosus NRRL 11379]MYR82274.1 MerR family transcriptional regulator [Streptomyces sp. SID5466]USC46283.1 MerR family transcriptional regulator [Streptomyces filamentosus]
MTSMRISQLAERSGVPATTLRFYESAGLLSADRTPAGYRMYGEDAVDRLAFIGAAKHLGLALEEIGELVGVWEAGACRDVKADLRPGISARLAEAESRAVELAAFTASLRGALAHLDALPDRAGRCDPECGFLAPGAGTPAPGPAPVSGGSRGGQPVDVVLSPGRRAAREEAERWRSAPVACSLSGDGLRERTARWHEAVAGATRTDVPEGLRLTLPVDRVARIAELAAAEQACCPFFGFRLHLDGPYLHLEVRAPADGGALLTDLFGSAG